MPAKGTRRGTPEDSQPQADRTAPPAAVFRVMRVIVNGQPVEGPDGATIAELLGRLGVRREFTAVALNREVVRRTAYASTVLRDGDRLEIVHPMAGGA